MDLNILVLPGDGIGNEVTREAVKVLRHVAKHWNHKLNLTEGLLGGVAIHKTGTPFPMRPRTWLPPPTQRFWARWGCRNSIPRRPKSGPKRACWEFVRRWAYMPIYAPIIRRCDR